MSNKILFSMIGVLMFAIAGVSFVVVGQGFAKLFAPAAPQASAAETPAASLTDVQTPQAITTAQQPTAPAQNKPTPAPKPQPTPTPKPSGPPSFTMAQVAAHNTRSSCYAVVAGNVYDLTSYVSRHPGGAGAIMSLCGTDATVAFAGQHGGQARPASELAGFMIGALAR